jgi:hypothetical protein
VRRRDANVGVQHTGATAHSCCGLGGGCFASVFLCVFSVSQGWINFFSLPDGLRHLIEDSILSIQRSQNAGGVARKARHRVEHDKGP